MADANKVIDRLTQQNAALAKENCILAVELEETREQLAVAEDLIKRPDAKPKE